jgi:hypothetical protein
MILPNMQNNSSNYQGNGVLLPNYGWVQNTSNLLTIRNTVDLVPDFGISHNRLMRNIYEYRTMEGTRPRRWSWDARCRIKAICATGMVILDRDTPGYTLTDLGKELKNCAKEFDSSGKRILSDKEIKIFQKGILTNPPVIRVLQLLNEDRHNNNKGMTKYDIGNDLGFVGDVGFTHYDPEWIARNDKSFNDVEGDSDKWARTILSWLQQVNWAVPIGKKKFSNGKKLSCYTTTYEVDYVLRTKAKSVRKYIPSEMLCSHKHPFSKQIQRQRSKLLSILENKATFGSETIIEKMLETEEAYDKNNLKFDILNLTQAGIDIAFQESTDSYKLIDNIQLHIDTRLFESQTTTVLAEDESTLLEQRIRNAILEYEDSFPPKLVGQIIRYVSGAAETAALFEMSVTEFFNFLGFDAEKLGQGKGRVADILVKYKGASVPRSYAIIVDTKASMKYSFPASDIRKMKEYISYHVQTLMREDLIPNHAFAFISNDFSEPSGPLNEIAEATDISGTAITVDMLLAMGYKVRKREQEICNLYPTFTTNQLYSL